MDKMSCDQKPLLFYVYCITLVYCVGTNWFIKICQMKIRISEATKFQQSSTVSSSNSDVKSICFEFSKKKDAENSRRAD